MRVSPGAPWVGVALFVATVAIGCSSGTDVTRDELAAVVERDGVAFAGETIPDVVLDRMAASRVVILGETHHLREHWDFVAELMGGLHARGFRQLLLERPQMEDWILDDWARGGLLQPGWTHSYYEQRYGAIRDVNQALPADERFRVRAVDVNLDVYGGAGTFASLLGSLVDHFPAAEPIEDFLGGGYAAAAPPVQTAMLGTLLVQLEEDRQDLVEAWGAGWYEHVVEMAEVELATVPIRSELEGDAASQAREDLIKELTDARIAASPGGTVINIGAHHAQKARLLGTDQEWLGDYLVHRSEAVAGTVYVVDFRAATIELLPGAGGTPFDVVATSPDNELFRVMAETWPDRTVFLPLDDAMFGRRRVAINSEERIYGTTFRDQYDAVIQYDLAHRLPEG